MSNTVKIRNKQSALDKHLAVVECATWDLFLGITKRIITGIFKEPMRMIPEDNLIYYPGDTRRKQEHPRTEFKYYNISEKQFMIRRVEKGVWTDIIDRSERELKDWSKEDQHLIDMVENLKKQETENGK